MRHPFALRVAALAICVAGLLAGHLGLVAPWMSTWGATREEATRPLPGDAIVPAAARQETRAITVRAPVERVWPWLAQIGQDRGGFYSYRILENAVGCDMPDADRIHPEFQAWTLRDQLWMYPPDKADGVGHADLVALEPGHALGFATWFEPPRAGEPPRGAEGSWSFVAEPAAGGTTRLLVRGRSAAAGSAFRTSFERLVYDPMHFVMERKMMTELAARAEGHAPTPVADGLVVTSWCVVFASFVAAAVLLLRGRPLARAVHALLTIGVAFAALTLLQPGLAPSLFVALAAVFVVPWRREEPGRTALLDRVLPDGEFAGRVSVPVSAAPRALVRAFREVTLAEMPVARALGELRYLPGRLLGKHRPPPPLARPFVEELLAGGNVVLAEDPDREIVLGAVGKFHQLGDQQPVRLADAGDFASFTDPAYQKLAMSFRVEDVRGARRLVLEHRTHALSPRARRAFAVYWLVIGPMGNLVSWLLLRAVRRRAEARPASPGATSPMPA